jgi:hypothetical protein
MKKMHKLVFVLLLILVPAMLFAQTKPIVLRLAETIRRAIPRNWAMRSSRALSRSARMAASSSRCIPAPSSARKKR